VDLLRFATAGSVDDGKSTLIGRLLYDSKAILEDQWTSIERVSTNRGDDYVDLALLTDGLRAEREQGITIDVAYRYFATPRRKFIIADTPGHVQYTRNMVTGASTADLALILIDARNGIVEQSRRHAYLASLLGIRHLVVCVNKMDLVDYEESQFDAIRQEFTEFAERLGVPDVGYIPISALHGANVVERSELTPWYEGRPLLEYLEEVDVAPEADLERPRFPVQYVVRPVSDSHRDYRGYAGTVAGGLFHPGDEVLVLPSGVRTRVEAIDSFDGEVAEACPPMSVVLRLADDLDVSRGDMICGAINGPQISQSLEAMVCWMAEDSDLTPGLRLAIKHTTRRTRATVREIRYRTNVNSLHIDGTATSLRLNEIGRVHLRTMSPLMFDEYAGNRTTGSFILIDEVTNNTVGAGMILMPEGDDPWKPDAYQI